MEKKINSLEKLKNEILDEVGLAKKETKVLHWNSFAVYVVLIALTFFSIAQTVESAVILNRIKNGKIQTAGSATQSTTPLPANLENLPNMVGGC